MKGNFDNCVRELFDSHAKKRVTALVAASAKGKTKQSQMSELLAIVFYYIEGISTLEFDEFIIKIIPEIVKASNKF